MMKKRYLLGAAVCASSALIAGTALAQSADTIMQDYADALQAQNTYTEVVTMAGDITFATTDGSMTIAVNGTGDMTVRVCQSPLAVSVAGTFSGSALGQAMSADLGLYLITEDDGSITMYTGMNDEWSVSTLEAEESSGIPDLISTYSQMSDLPITFSLTETDSTYVLTNDIAWGDLPSILTWAYEKAADTIEGDAAEAQESLDEVIEQLSGLDMYLGGLVLHTQVDLDNSTCLPISSRTDLTGSDLTSIEEILSSLLAGFVGDDAELTTTIGDAYISSVYDYSDTSAITVPDDVISGATTADPSEAADSLNDLLAEF